MLGVIADDAAQAELRLDLDELFREGARRILADALEAEVDAYIAGYADQVDKRGHRLVRRNGHAPARTIATGVGRVEVARPRVDDPGWTRPPASGPSPTARSCPGGAVARRRSPRCCRCCICTGCPAPTLSRR